MRWLVSLALAASCAHLAPPVDPEVPASFTVAAARRPLPAYGGAKWTSPCAVELAPASAAEQTARIAAMQTWFPGATIRLAALGDRARAIELPARGGPPASRESAEAVARRVVGLAAPLFGVQPHVRRVATTSTKRWWIVDLEVRTDDFTRALGEHQVAIVVRIDRATGAVQVGLAGEVMPVMPACEHEPPPVETERVIAALVAKPFGHGPPLTADDLVFDNAISAESAPDGRSSHGVVTVAVGPHLADLACGPERGKVADATGWFVWVDATTYEVVGGEPAHHPIFDEAGVALDPREDARRAFGHR